MFKSALFALGLAAAAQAIKVTSPTDDSIWQSGTSSQTVSWEAVDTDKTSFAILLINQAGFLTNSPVTLVQNQSTGAANQVNSVTVTFPNGAWPTGTAFQINLVSSTNSDSAILAQSPQFNITSGGSSGGSSASSSTGSAPTTISGSSTRSSAASTIPAVTNTNGQPAGASTGATSSNNALPNAVTSATGAASMGKSVQSGAVWSVLLGAAALMGVTL